VTSVCLAVVSACPFVSPSTPVLMIPLRRNPRPKLLSPLSSGTLDAGRP
jgi:hypothetical protein